MEVKSKNVYESWKTLKKKNTVNESRRWSKTKMWLNIVRDDESLNSKIEIKNGNGKKCRKWK